jgi:hypothetical protein
LKKWVVILSLIILATITYTTWSAESDYYVKTVRIYKIYHHKKGFVVTYEKQSLDVFTTFIPYAWFDAPKEKGERLKAEVLYKDLPEYPYMNIYWDKNGFSHVRLYLQEKKTHPSYGSLTNPNVYDNSFAVDAPVLQF